MKTLAALLALVSLTLTSTFAQPGPMGGGGFGGNPAIVKFFGSNNSFSATCAMKMTGQSGDETMSGEMKYAMLDGKVRVDIDMTKMKSAQMPAAAMAQMKQLGMTELTSIMRQDLKLAYIIYPGLASYAKMPLRAQDAAAMEKAAKVEVTKLGEETIDGHPCVKNQAVVTDDSGAKHEALLWNATDLKDFPVQIQSTEAGNTAIMTFKNISIAKPDTKLFEPPTGFTAYENVQMMMMASMQKMMGSGSMPPQ